MRGSRRTSVYTIRENGLKTFIRHPLIDSWVLEEVFGDHAYDLPPRVIERFKGHQRPLRVVDLGGHVGMFGLFALGRFPAARIVSFEPDPANVETLRGCIRANGFEDRWEVVPAASGTSDGVLDFVSNLHLSHAVGRPTAVDADTLRRVFPFLAKSDLMAERRLQVPVKDCFPALLKADLIKIDIEGSEWPLLRDPRFERLGAGAIVMECHRTSSPEPDVSAYVSSRLEAAGYEWMNLRDLSAEAILAWAVKPTGTETQETADALPNGAESKPGSH